MTRTTTFITLLAVAGTIGLAGCTVKDVDQPSLTGPSTYATSIVMTASKTVLTQNGFDSADISITSLGPSGQSQSVPLQAQVFVNDVAMDFGTLSTKTPTTPATIRYTAPSAAAASGQTANTVTIRVTPASSGDFRGEFSRELDLRLIPQGVILPSNPNLAASFTATPNPAMVLQTVEFDASGTASSVDSAGAPVACATRCTYNWTFGDGNSASGLTPFHAYRAIGTYVATLTATDAFGAQAVTTRSIVVNPGTPPTATFTVSPTSAGVDQVIFFNASESRPATGRTIVSYDWDFGSGRTATGVTTSKSYSSAGTYRVTLRVTDDAGSVGQRTVDVTVTASTNGGSVPTAAFTISPSTTATAGTTIFFDASASRPFSTTAPIVSYRWTWGDNTPDTTTQSNQATHAFPSGTGARTYVVRLTVTDSEGRVGTITGNVSVQ